MLLMHWVGFPIRLVQWVWVSELNIFLMQYMDMLATPATQDCTHALIIRINLLLSGKANPWLFLAFVNWGFLDYPKKGKTQLCIPFPLAMEKFSVVYIAWRVCYSLYVPILLTSWSLSSSWDRNEGWLGSCYSFHSLQHYGAIPGLCEHSLNLMVSFMIACWNFNYGCSYVYAWHSKRLLWAIISVILEGRLGELGWFTLRQSQIINKTVHKDEYILFTKWLAIFEFSF